MRFFKILGDFKGFLRIFKDFFGFLGIPEDSLRFHKFLRNSWGFFLEDS